MSAARGAVASSSGRWAPSAAGSARQRVRAAQRQRGTSLRVHSSLEEEFKKHLLQHFNGDPSISSQAERLKDLSAAASSSSSVTPSSSSSSSKPGSSAAPGSSSLPQDPCGEAAGGPAGGLGLGGEPYHPLEFFPTSHIDLDWGAGRLALPGGGNTPTSDRARCFVILFGVGRAETEGIYSLRALAKEDGLPVDTIVAFEAEDDAQRYSTLLEATMDHEPTVWPIEWGELLEFCNTSGYRCRLEPAGSLLIPPDYNVSTTDWEKSLKLRRGEFSVLGAEPARPSPPNGLFVDGPAWASLYDEDDVRAEMQLNAVIDQQLSSPAGLEAMRAHLENLLPQEE